MIQLGGAYGEIVIGTDQAESNVKGLASQMADVGKTLSLGVSAPLLGVAATALKSAGDFEQAMNQMQVISGATGAQMKEMQGLALQLGADTSFSAGEAAQGLLELSKAGLSAEQAMKAIPGVMDLAAAGDLSVAQAAEIASNALNAFHLPAEKAADVANLFAAAANASSIGVNDVTQSMAQVSAVAASYGQSIGDTTNALALLGKNSLKGSDAGTSLKTMLSRLAAPTEESAALMKQLGINVYDASGKMRPLPAILADMQKGLHGTMTITEQNAGATSANSKQAKHYLDIINQTKQKLADYQSGVAGVAQSEKDKVVAVDRLNRVLRAAQAEYAKLGGVQGTTTTKTVQMTDELRNQALYTLFGSDAIRAANILLKEGATGWDEMSAAVNKEGVAQDVANARMKGFNGAIEYVKGSLDSFLIETALPFLDSFSWLIRYVGDAVTGLGKLPDPLKNAALAFLAVLAVAGPVLLAITGVGAVLGALLSPVGLVVLAVAALAAAWASDFGGIREKTQAAIDFLRPGFKELLSWISAASKGDFTPLKEGLQGALQKVTATIQEFKWADFVTKLSDWSVYVAKLAWDGFIVALDWATYLSEMAWSTYLSVLTWGDYVAKLAWNDWLVKVDWSGYVTKLGEWSNYIAKLTWSDFVKALTWDIYVTKLAWSTIIKALADWGPFIAKLSWSGIIKALTWDVYITKLAWTTFLHNLSWSGFISMLQWAGYVPSLIWNTFIDHFSWSDVKTFDWKEFVPNLVWLNYITPVGWATYIIKLAWTDYITQFAWKDWVAKLSWPTTTTTFVWKDWVPKLSWPNATSVFSWSAFIEKLKWPDLSFDWDDYVPDIKWKDWISAVKWSDFVTTIAWKDYIPDFGKWSDYVSDILKSVIPGNAGGSSYFMGGMTHLNERGRELVAIPADQAILPAGSRIYTNGQANRMMAGGGEGGGNLVNIEKVYVTNQQDIHALAWQVDNLRRRQAGR